MIRRSFLGTILGLVGTTPFQAKAVPPKRLPEKILAMKRRVDIFFEDPKKLRDYAIYAKIAKSEERVFMPEILEVEIVPDLMRVTFKAKELNVQTRMQIDALGLLNADGEMIMERPIAASAWVLPGDKFNATITIEMRE